VRHVLRLFDRLASELTKAERRRGARRLSAVERFALDVIREAYAAGRPASAMDVTRRVGVSGGRTTAVLDRLEEQHLISRTRVAHDRRMRLLIPTDTELDPGMNDAVSAAIIRTATTLPDDDWAAVERFLDAVVTELERDELA
jgi:DNA-binding MarR family transcriptional regulator